MRVLVQMIVSCPKHPRPDVDQCTNCQLAAQFEKEKEVIEARRGALLERMKAAIRSKAVVISEFK